MGGLERQEEMKLQASQFIPYFEKYFPDIDVIDPDNGVKQPTSIYVVLIALCHGESDGNANSVNTNNALDAIDLSQYGLKRDPDGLSPRYKLVRGYTKENHTWYAHRASHQRFTYGSYGPMQTGAFAYDATYFDKNGKKVSDLNQAFDPETNICISQQIWKGRGGSFEEDWGAYGAPKFRRALEKAQEDYDEYKGRKKVDVRVHKPSPEPTEAPPQAQAVPEPVKQPAKQTKPIKSASVKPDDPGYGIALRSTGKAIAEQATDWIGGKKSKAKDEGMRVSKKMGWSTVINAKLHLFVFNLEEAHPWLEAYDWLLVMAIAFGIWFIYWVIGKISLGNYVAIKQNIANSKKSNQIRLRTQWILGSKSGAVDSARKSGDWRFHDLVYGGE